VAHSAQPADLDVQIAAVLNAAWADARALPRVVAFPVEIPEVGPDEVAERRRLGDGQALVTHDVARQPVAVVEATVVGDGEGRIGWFGTHPDCRRQGYASSCLGTALQFLRQRAVREVQTLEFVDSRLECACAFLESAGFVCRDPHKQNMVMQIDLQHYTPRPVDLPPPYSIVSLRDDLVPGWCEVKDGVFGGSTEPEWFRRAFMRRWDFSSDGWFLLTCEGHAVGIAAADLFRYPNDPDRISGCQIEWVGVLPQHRGRRLGEALVTHCLNYAHAHQAWPCQLITQEFRVPAVRLYEALGFGRVRENRTYSLILADEDA